MSRPQIWLPGRVYDLTLPADHVGRTITLVQLYAEISSELSFLEKVMQTGKFQGATLSTELLDFVGERLRYTRRVRLQHLQVIRDNLSPGIFPLFGMELLGEGLLTQDEAAQWVDRSKHVMWSRGRDIEEQEAAHEVEDVDV